MRDQSDMTMAGDTRDDRTNGDRMHDEHRHEDHKKDDHKHEPGRAIAALFESKEEARQALGMLHKEHYTRSWAGVTSTAHTRTGEETLTMEDAKPGFFSQTSQNIVDALVERGVLGETARELESKMSAGQAVVTVEPGDKDPSEAMNILQRCGGKVSGSSGMSNGINSTMQTGATTPLTGTDTGYAGSTDPSAYDEEIFYQTPR